MKGKFLTLAVLFAVSAALASCGKSETKTSQSQESSPLKPAKEEPVKPQPLTELANSNLPKGHPPIDTRLPEGHPPINRDLMAMHSGKNLTKFDRPINIPEEVQKTWKSATIDLYDKTAGKVVKEFKVKKGETVNYGGLEIKVLYIVPHLVLDNGYTSASNEPQNPAILVEVKENGKVIYAGPIYQKFPTMYNVNHPRYQIFLKGISKE